MAPPVWAMTAQDDLVGSACCAERITGTHMAAPRDEVRARGVSEGKGGRWNAHLGQLVCCWTGCS